MEYRLTRNARERLTECTHMYVCIVQSKPQRRLICNHGVFYCRRVSEVHAFYIDKTRISQRRNAVVVFTPAALLFGSASRRLLLYHRNWQ